MTNPINLLTKIADYISNIWHIATSKGVIYEYIIEDIELREHNDSFNSIIYYRVIGSRNIEYASASELNESGVFSKFMPAQAQAIVTLATLESVLKIDSTTLVIHHREYIKKCVKIFRSQRGR